MIRWRRRSAVAPRPAHRVGGGTTATSTPRRSRSAARNSAALASGSSGSSASSVVPMFEPSTRPRLWTSPRRFSVISVGPSGPARARPRVDQLAAQVSRSSGSDGAGTIRPSHFDTTLLVTTTTSPSRSHGAASAMAAGDRRRANSGRPATGKDLEGAAVAMVAAERRRRGSPLGSAVERGRRWGRRRAWSPGGSN